MANNKVGILTFHRADNCGAVLQAYALCETMKSLCCGGAEIIDYRCAALERANSLLPIESGKKLPKSLIRAFLRLPIALRIQKSFAQFRQAYLSLSPTSYYRNNVGDTLKRYCQFIVGSDQVFNTELKGDDASWFLDFVPYGKMKHSYAASFGNAISFNKSFVTAKMYLKDFQGVSLREDTGIDQLKDSGIPCEKHLDPVFLFAKDRWLSLAGEQTSPAHNPYLLYYEIRPERKLFAYAKTYARQNGLELFCVSQRLRLYMGAKRVYFLDPLSFINMIVNAAIVFTTSFHVLAFSLLLERDFYTETIDAYGTLNNRINDLLRLVNIGGRDVSHDNECLNAKAIDWGSVGAIINNERKRSLAYLGGIGGAL